MAMGWIVRARHRLETAIRRRRMDKRTSVLVAVAVLRKQTLTTRLIQVHQSLQTQPRWLTLARLHILLQHPILPRP